MHARHPKKYLEDGVTLNPKWKKRDYPKKYLEDGITINPKWKKRGHPKKYLEDGVTLNPKWKKQDNSRRTRELLQKRVLECIEIMNGVEYGVAISAYEKFDVDFDQYFSHIPESSPALSIFRGFIYEVYNLRILSAINQHYDIDLDKGILNNISCLNCGKPLTVESNFMFCSELCQQEAQLIRYTRRKIIEGTIWIPDIQESGIGVRLLMVTGGGYPYKDREVPPDVRKAVFERDNDTCQICGSRGTQIDHINGSSNDPSNIQVVCKNCNLSKIITKNISKESTPEIWQSIQKQITTLAARAASNEPIQICDDETIWNSIYRKIQTVRRYRFLYNA